VEVSNLDWHQCIVVITNTKACIGGDVRVFRFFNLQHVIGGIPVELVREALLLQLLCDPNHV